jgi:hypothetical protein
MGNLTGRQWQDFTVALRSAFPRVSLLEMMARFGLDQNLADLVPDKPTLQEATFELVKWAQAEGRVDQLLFAARNQNPGNPELRLFAERLGLAPNSAALESVYTPGTALVPVEEWRQRMSLRELCVCRIEIAGFGNGTGSLVGPSFVLTNWHVLSEIFKEKRPASSIVCRFDYKVAGDGTLCKGVEYRLAQDWLVDASPVEDLDYALLKLSKSAGNDPVSNQQGSPSRGWLRPEAHSFQTHEHLFIIQHPEATPLKLGVGKVGKVSDNQKRICHDVDTEPGSSGSPCFTMDWTFVAFHQHGKNFAPECEKNGAINIAKVTDQPKIAAALRTF